MKKKRSFDLESICTVDDTNAEERDSGTCAFISCIFCPRDIPPHEQAVFLSTPLAPT